jgi:hypothetical protein
MDMILEASTTTSRPSPILYQSVMCRLSYIFYICVKTNKYQITSRYIRAMEEIETVRRNLPIYLSSKFPANIDDEEWESEFPWVTFQRYCITHSLEFMQLSIARTLAMGNMGGDSTRYRETAMNSANNILHSYMTTVPRVYKLVWTISASTVAAALYTSLDLLMYPHDYTALKKQEHINLLKQVAQQLDQYSCVSIHAAKGSASIKRLLSRLEQDFSMSQLSVHDILRSLTTQGVPLALESITDDGVIPAQPAPAQTDGWIESIISPDSSIGGHFDGPFHPSDTWGDLD